MVHFLTSVNRWGKKSDADTKLTHFGSFAIDIQMYSAEEWIRLLQILVISSFYYCFSSSFCSVLVQMQVVSGNIIMWTHLPTCWLDEQMAMNM